jgi:Flp pilus assembly pilin Flp
MKETVTRLARESGGQDLAEYGIALAVIAVAIATAALVISGNTNMLWTRGLQAIVVAVLGA